MKAPILFLSSTGQIESSLHEALSFANFAVTVCSSIREVKERLFDGHWEAFLIEAKLTVGAGIQLLEEIRQYAPSRPVFLLTSTSHEEMAVLNLRMHRVDYIRMNAESEEFVIRLKRALGKEGVLSLGSMGINFSSRRVEVNGKAITLRRREFDILTALAKKPGHVLKRDELLAIVKAGEDCSDRAIDCHLSRLRKKLVEAGAKDITINSVYGVGYSVTEAA